MRVQIRAITLIAALAKKSQTISGMNDQRVRLHQTKGQPASSIHVLLSSIAIQYANKLLTTDCIFDFEIPIFFSGQPNSYLSCLVTRSTS